MNRLDLRGTMSSQSMRGGPCTWQRNPSSAYSSARTMPDRASLNEASTSWVLFPILETTPIPVTTTRLINQPFLVSSRGFQLVGWGLFDGERLRAHEAAVLGLRP